MKPYSKTIGGFFGLEGNDGTERSPLYHSEALALSTGRACMNFICKKVQVNLVYLPFYCCDALIQPVLQNKIAYKFYAVNADFEISDEIKLGPGEFVVYINYFGIKSAYCKELMTVYGDHLILDYTQSFFEKGENTTWSFNSARKFFGVPDGGFLYGPDLRTKKLERNPFYQYSHLVEKKYGNQEDAYAKFIAYESQIRSDVYRISLISENVLRRVSMNEIKKKRKENFSIYFKAFAGNNLLRFEDISYETPFAYPLLLEKKVEKSILHQSGIYIPTLWNDPLQRPERKFNYERYLCERLLPLPLDQRYGEEDCQIVIKFIKKMI